MEKEQLIQLVEKEINSFIDSINKLNQIKDYSINNNHWRKEVRKLQNKSLKELQKFTEVLNEIQNKVSILTKNLNLIRELDWDTLHVAFFGETNAGKSTLIEALIGGDGRTIGDGRKDFTRTIKNFRFGQKIQIMDMPGIEGDENKVRKEIWKATNKAHVIFYVYPDTKEPERGTLEKIKKYLRRNAEIYTILNLRGIFPPQVLDRKKQTAKVIRNRTDKHLKETLGDTYKGSLQLHALFGFFARARSIPQHLQTQYKTALKFYGTGENLKKVSNIDELITLLQTILEDSPTKILWGNYRKILITQEEIIGKLLSWKAEFDKNIKELYREVSNLKQKFEREKKILEKNLEQVINAKAEKLRARLKNVLAQAIEKEYETSYIEGLIISEIENFKKELQREFNIYIEDFKERISEEIEILQKNIEYLYKFNAPFELKSIFEKLGNSLVEIFREIGDIVWSIVFTFLFYLRIPILGIPIGLVHVIRKIWDWFFSNPSKRKANAKREAYKKVDETVERIKSQLRKKLNDTYKEMDRQFKQLLYDLNSINRNLRGISKVLDSVVANLIKSNTTIAYYFLKHLDPEVEFGYIQLRLKEGSSLVAVTPNKHPLEEKLKALTIKNVYLYSSTEEMFNDIFHRDNEFFRRLKRLLWTE